MTEKDINMPDKMKKKNLNRINSIGSNETEMYTQN
jgi:hypothetical protein